MIRLLEREEEKKGEWFIVALRQTNDSLSYATYSNSFFINPFYLRLYIYFDQAQHKSVCDSFSKLKP